MIWRALFLALGITMILLGSQLFFVEQVEIRQLRPATPNTAANTGSAYDSAFQNASAQQPAPAPRTVTISRKEWMPWSLLAIGSIVVIYTFTIPRRGGD